MNERMNELGFRMSSPLYARLPSSAPFSPYLHYSVGHPSPLTFPPESVTMLNPHVSMVSERSSLRPTMAFSERCRETGTDLNPYSIPTRQNRVDFPCFAGEDLRGWLYRCEGFFEWDATPWDMKVTMAVVHLKGQALQWHQVFMLKWMTRDMPRWEEYVQALNTRFGVTALNDSWAERVTWRQTGERDEWVETFDSLAGWKRPSHVNKIPLQVGSNPPAVLPIALKQQLPKNMGVVGMMLSRSPTISEPVSELVRNDIMKGTINYYCSSEADVGASNEKDCAVEINTTRNGSKDEGANCAKQYSAEVGFADAMLVIEFIRRYEFGLDSDLCVTESSMLRKQHARLGRTLHSIRESTSPPVVLEKKKDRPGWLQPYRQRTLLMHNYFKPTSLYYGHFLILSQFESARIGMPEFYDLMEVLSDALKRNYYDSEPMRCKCGVTIDSNFTQAEGRVLPSLRLKVGNGEELFPRTGRWNFNNRKLVEPTKIQRWIVANFSSRGDTRSLVRGMIKCGNMRGISIENPLDVFEEKPQWRQTPPDVRVEKIFAEKLFSRLQTCNEWLEKYVQPSQRDVTTLLVPPDAVEPLFKQIVNQFIHDRSRPEAIAVELNVVREMCLRIPLLMTEDLLQDLVRYKKFHEKAISAAARSLMSLFREICPSMLVKKDRGRPADPMARPKTFGEVSVVCDVPGIEFLQDTEGGSGRDDVDGEDAAIEGRSEIDESEFGFPDDENSEDDNVNDNEEDAYPLKMRLTHSEQICSIYLLEQIIDDAESNKKTLLSVVELVITMMKEVEVQERASELAKEESERGRVQIFQSLRDSGVRSLSLRVLFWYLPPLQMPYDPGRCNCQQLAKSVIFTMTFNVASRFRVIVR